MRDGSEYLINGHKTYISGAAGRACKILIVMGKTDPANPDRHRQQSMVLVPTDTAGVEIVRAMTVFGYDDAPEGHAEVIFRSVRVPADHVILGGGIVGCWLARRRTARPSHDLDFASSVPPPPHSLPRS